jgi:hypothetical protein
MTLSHIFDVQTTCTKCKKDLTSPEWFERMSDGQVHYLWRCTKCGYEFETAVHSHADPEPGMSESDWEEMFPPLLVA